MSEGSDRELSTADRAYQIHKSLREYEEHFNHTQVEVKKLASAWTLAVFAGIAFIVRGDLTPDKSLLDSGVLLVLIGLGGNVGLLCLWLLDQRVNQQLLRAVFEVGLTLEVRHPELPAVRSLMWVNSNGKGMGRFHTLFYAAPMFLNALAGTFGLWISHQDHWMLALLLAFTLAAFFAVLLQWARPTMEPQPQYRSAAIYEAAARWSGKDAA